MIDIKVRWNTQCKDDHNYWRIIIDGEEHICSGVIFKIPTYTTKDMVWDTIRQQTLEKHHISCQASEVIWNGDVVVVS